MIVTDWVSVTGTPQLKQGSTKYTSTLPNTPSRDNISISPESEPPSVPVELRFLSLMGHGGAVIQEAPSAGRSEVVHR